MLHCLFVFFVFHAFLPHYLEIDECRIPFICPANSDCIETLPSGYICECHDRYQGPRCTNINECLNIPCWKNGNHIAECKDTDGSFNCACPDGFSGNGFSCNIRRILIKNAQLPEICFQGLKKPCWLPKTKSKRFVKKNNKNFVILDLPLRNYNWLLFSEVGIGVVLKKKVFLKMLQNSQEKTCAGIPF